MVEEKLNTALNKYDVHIKTLTTIAIIFTGILSASAVYALYKSSIWKPTVVVNDVDFTSAVAHLTVNGKAEMLYGNDVLNAGGGIWGVRFGTTGTSSNSYNTIEVVKNDMVFEILKIKSTT